MRAYRVVDNRLLVVLTAFLLAALVLFFFARGTPARAEEEPVVEGYVVGGTAVPNGKYPFVAALLNKGAGGTAYNQQFCGGALIDRNSVLTAAHCARMVPRRSLRIVVGRTVLNSKQGSVRRAARVFVHPRYNPDRNQAYDVAVIRLDKQVRGVRPIRPTTAKQDVLEERGHKLTVAGWGNTKPQPPGGSTVASFPNRMRETRVPVRPDGYARTVYGPLYVSSLMVAAGKSGRDTCQGDSGGPIFGKLGGDYRQVGVTSFGRGCGAPGNPGVYTEANASSVRGFITRTARR